MSQNERLPCKLYCRDLEIENLQRWIHNSILTHRSRSLYISGPPGTGKTACLKHCLLNLKDNCKFKEIYVNCMAQTSSLNVFRMVALCLGCTVAGRSFLTVSRQIAKCLVDSKETIVLVLDELDQICTKNNESIYAAFAWPFLRGSKLCLIGVANSLDLTERCLTKLNLKSHEKPEVMHFAPYTKEQILIILQKSKKTATTISSAAMEFCARKVSANSGDIRKVFNICQVSEHERLEANQIEVGDVVTTLKSMTCQPSSTVLPYQQKLVLVTLAKLLRNSASKRISLFELFNAYKENCSALNSDSYLDYSDCVGLCNILEGEGWIRYRCVKNSQKQVELFVNPSTIESLVKDDPRLLPILSS